MAMQGKYSMAHNHNYVQRRAAIEGGGVQGKNCSIGAALASEVAQANPP
jgi:hypothetical protein